MRTFRFLPIVSALVSIPVAPATLAIETTLPRHEEPGQYGVTLGAEYSRGNYGGSADTDIWYFPLSFSYEQDRWLYRVTIPYLSVDGPGDVLIVGGGGRGTHVTTSGAGTVTTNRTDSGIGDTVGAISYRLLGDAARQTSIDLTGKVYFGTADEARGLGTGEDDYAAQLDVAHGVGAATVFGTLGYRVTGNPPGVDYKDVPYGTLGIERAFTRNTVGVALDAEQAYLSGNDAFVTLTGYLTVRPEKRTKLTAYLFHGVSDATPDWGVGVTYGWFY